MYNPFSLAGKTILVTGASSGIGRATAIECSKMGATLCITARNEARLRETFDKLEGNGHQMIIADLTNRNELQALVDQCPELDGLVNNAGKTETILTSFITEEKLNSILDVNTISPILLMQKLLKTRKIRKGSSIVFTCSLCGVYSAILGNAIYSTSKAAINGFVKNAAIDLVGKGIRVNDVCPGMIDTDILSAGVVTHEQLEENKKQYPMKRYGRPEEVAWAIIYLLSDASSFTTGTSLLLDGGITLKA